MREDAHGDASLVRAGAGEPPHPLAVTLASALPRGVRVLVVGPGRGRSLPPLQSAGFRIETAPADEHCFTSFPGPYDGILSTHALLHGTPQSVAERVLLLGERLAHRGRLHATFGSSADARCGVGRCVDGAWLPQDGDEAGVPHAYFDRAGIEGMLRAFAERRIEERDVRAIAGRWAHSTAGAGLPSVHWFVEARGV